VIYRIFARRIEDASLSITNINSYWSQKAKNFICDHPVHFLKLLFIKVNFFFHNFRRHDLSNVYWNDQKLQKTLPTIPYALISAMALIGMVLSGKIWKKRLLIYAVFFSQFGIILLTYASDRQRVAIVAIMIFFASEALNASVQKRKYLLLTWLVTLILFPLLYNQNDLMKDDIYTWNRYTLSNKFMSEARQERKNENLPLASEKNTFSFALAPGFIDDRRLAKLSFTPKSFQEQALGIAISSQEYNFPALFDLAVLSIEAGQFTEAEALLFDLVDKHYQFNRQYIQSSQPYFYLSRLYVLQNNRLEAIASLEKALQNNPGDPWVLSYLASLTNDQRYKNKLFRYFDAIDTEFFLGRAYLETGRAEEAVKSFSYVVEKIPEYRKGVIYLSIALGATGKYEQAARMYLHAIKKRREPIFREKEVLTIFRRWAKQNSQNAEASYYLGVILREFGHYEEALNIQQILLEKYPSQPEVRQNIEWLQEALDQYSHR
jgi:tetratricopeptide (TPR) repeat protein